MRKKKRKVVNSHVLEPSRSESSWWMCTVAMIHQKYHQTVMIRFVKKEIKAVWNLKGFTYHESKAVLGWPLAHVFQKPIKCCLNLDVSWNPRQRRRNLISRAVEGKWRPVSSVSSHWPCFRIRPRNVSCGEAWWEISKNVTAGGTMLLASPACTYTCTPSLIFLSFRCSNPPFESSPSVCHLGSFCPNIYAFLKPMSSVLT